MTFKSVAQNIAMQNGLYACFSPKPLSGQCGNGLHINISIKSPGGQKDTDAFIAGILSHIREITAFLNPTEESYLRLGEQKAAAIFDVVLGKPLSAYPHPCCEGGIQAV